MADGDKGNAAAGLDPELRRQLEAMIAERVEAEVAARLDAAVDQRVRELAAAAVDERLAAVESTIRDAQERLDAIEANGQIDQVSILVFSGDLDRLMSAFIIATGAVAMGFDVAMYFTFWGLLALKKKTVFASKSVPERMLAAMLPGGPGTVGTSRMNMLGMGPALFRRLMRQHNVESLPDLITLAQELGVKMVACQMAMGVMGVRREELIDGLRYGGAVTYLGDAVDSKVTLFI
ncbi:MAG: DsrE/DsrF/DrsH-like family protein [Myxococcales bacterium]|nr:DsrE/DsrF/DrsH-like family protein [Myxococcales bacterium]